MVMRHIGALILAGVLASACSRKAPARRGQADAAPPSAPLPAASARTSAEVAKPAVPSTALPKLEDAYEGSIDPSLDVVMRLQQHGTALSGSYVYESKGIAIDLAGSIGSDGEVTLKESLGNKPTGSFTGRAVTSGNLVGIWADASDQNPRAFRLRPILRQAKGPARVVKKLVRYRMKPLHRAPPGAPVSVCSADVALPEVLGLGSEAVEAMIDEKLRKGHPFAATPTSCEDAIEAHGTFEVHLNRAGVLSVTVLWDEVGAVEAHPASGGAAVNVLVETGEELRLRDVLTPKGLDKAMDLLRPEVERRVGAFDGVLEDALRAGDFALEEKGIRFIAYFRLPHAIQAADEGVGFVVPYEKLAGGLKSGSKASGAWKP
jgi:hypothetical protein